MAEQSAIAQMAAHPGVFALGVGVANGLLAAVRNKSLSPNAAYVTAAVIAAGEVALVRYSHEWESGLARPDLARLGLWSLVGTMAGLALFVEWEPGKPSYIQRAGEALAERVPQPA